MPLLTGSFSNTGSPVLKVTIHGPFTNGIEYDSILDTGFTGFLSIPLIEAIRLGFVLYGTTRVSLADGSENFRLTAQCSVKIGEIQKVGVAILEPASTETLLGMGFLRLFEKAFFVSSTGVVLVDEKEFKKAEQVSQQKQSTATSEAATNPPTTT